MLRFGYVLVLVSKKFIFSWKKRSQSFIKKIAIFVEELDGIGNLENLLRIFFINKEYGSLNVFVVYGDLTTNINQKKSDV